MAQVQSQQLLFSSLLILAGKVELCNQMAQDRTSHELAKEHSIAFSINLNPSPTL